MRPEDEIHHAVGVFELVRHVLLLHHAAAHGDDLVGVRRLGVGQRADVPEHALLGVLAHGAGVENHEVRLRAVIRKAEAHVRKIAAQLFAVGLVLLAAEGVHHRERADAAREIGLADLCADLALARDLLRGDFRSFVSHSFKSFEDSRTD